VVAVVCLAALGVTGCTDGSARATGGHSVLELRSTPGPADPGHDFDPGPDRPDVSVPDLDDLADCIEQAADYASLAMLALGGEDPDSMANTALDQLRSSLPEDLRDDLQVVADAYRQVAEQGIGAGVDALASPEFDRANSAITQYLARNCDD
jgi:hypothetical protein